MKYSLGGGVLDTTQRTLSVDGDVFPIRPKTLEVLLYLADHQDKITSKENLLETLWPNVTVDEGVVFQSITEIRKLFSDPKIVINYPKRGYQLTQPLKPLTSSQTVLTKFRSSRPVMFSSLIVCGLILLTVFMVLFTTTIWVDEDAINNKAHNPSYQSRILILPVKSNVAYSESNWAGMSGMENIASRIQGNESTYIYTSYDVSALIHHLGIDELNDDVEFERIGKLSGASMVVESSVYGGVSNYNLVYKLHTTNKVVEGAVFGTTIDEAYANLVAKISNFMSITVNPDPKRATTEFNDALFAKALIAYESDWKGSVSFFETYLKLNPDSVIARIYLSRLYLWEGRIKNADDIITSTIVSQSTTVRQQAIIKFIQGRIIAQRSDWALAEKHYNEALVLLNETIDWSLKGDILQHKANVYEHLNKLPQALATLQTALSYYQFIESPIGINTIRLHLSRVYQKQGNLTQARALFVTAKQAIETQNLVFLESMLAEYKLTTST